MYQHIRTALTAQGQQVNSTHLSSGSCPSCHNPLELLHTYFTGRLFIHDQEHPDFNPDINCKYRAKMASTSSQTTDTLSTLRRTIMAQHVPLSSLPHRAYFCVLCQHKYTGPKTCPQCQQLLYTTESAPVFC
ncbi:zinc-ribbon domain-containing protein [Yersinia intermedia]|uniref:zinc-ribbon domain-containing protein n=1 Tax=Yersinia intermedia TaxID=631 RepID=UPI001CFCEEF1|nr:zinc-ribbon domain-containing protein [Yersinia intermedia]